MAIVTALLLHLTLAVPPKALPPVTLAHAVAEAAALWAPYGVAVDAADPCAVVADESMRLTVAIVTGSRSRVTPGWRGPLAAIELGPDGAPASTITLYLTDIVQFTLDTRVLGAEEKQWPPALRERIVGRAIGRVIAHEIGHYLLRTPLHTASGLMQAVHTAGDLVAQSRRRFGLSASDASRLAVDGHKERGPASAGPQHQTTARW
jgi:hypothetical protein